MYIQRNKPRNKKTGKIYSAVFLCSKYREGGKVKTRVEANLSRLPEHIIVGIENMLRSDKETPVCLKDIGITQCIDYGYVLVLLQMMKQLRIEEVFEKCLSESDALLVKSMLIGKIVTGGSKLCIYNWLCREKGICDLLGLNMNGRKVDQLYYSLGQFWLHQSKIEKKWFRYHQGSGGRVFLYDLTSTYFEGKYNDLAAYGYNRDGKQGKKQMCVGLLTGEDGFPLRIAAFSGNTSDSTTVTGQIRSLKDELGVRDIIFVGDRGMHIAYHLENDPQLHQEEIRFITGLTREQIKTLIARGTLQLSLFSSHLAEVSVDGKRYILSVNPDLEYKELSFLDHCRQRCDALVEEVRKSWQKRCEKNEENRHKKEENEGKGKYKHLKTELTQKDIKNYMRRVEDAVKKGGMNKYYTIELIDDQSFTVNSELPTCPKPDCRIFSNNSLFKIPTIRLSA
jgi:transposase